MTFRKLAKLASVSPATVSKVMSGSSEISAETAERVLRIAQENGMDVTRRKTLRVDPEQVRVLVLVPELSSIFYAQMATDVCEQLTAAGVEHAIRICGFDRGQTRSAVQEILKDGIYHGILSIARFTPSPDTLIPITVFGEETDSCDSVTIDFKSGMNDAIRHLKDLGHREIGMISEQLTNYKLQIFRDCMEQNDLPVREEFVWVSSKRFENIGYEAVQSMLDRGSLPTALITAYDEIALGAIHALQAAGVRVPEDISVVGINDIPFSAYSSIPLTTLQGYPRETIETAIQLLLRKIQNHNQGLCQHIRVKSRLILRKTTAPARK